MYYLYQVKKTDGKFAYSQKESISLAGIRSGIIPNFLKTQLSPDTKEPWKWYIRAEDILTHRKLSDHAIVIDIKPKSKTHVFLLELVEIWGYSDHGWTPILMRLKGLLVDEDVTLYDKKSFELKGKSEEEIIYSLLYLDGTVEDGKLKGKWTFPGPSPTNSLLLWPPTLKYFVEAIQKSTPHIF